MTVQRQQSYRIDRLQGVAGIFKRKGGGGGGG